MGGTVEALFVAAWWFIWDFFAVYKHFKIIYFHLGLWAYVGYVKCLQRLGKATAFRALHSRN